MKILIVGGNSSLAKVLRPVVENFAEVLTAGRSGCDVELDLFWHVNQFRLPSGLDTVINLSANFGGKDFDSIFAAEEVNVLGALKLSHACLCAGVRHLVQISSIFAGLNEDSPFYSSYALSKLHAEDLVSLYCRSVGLPLTILRSAQIYGDGDVFRHHQPFLYSIIDKAQHGEDITFFGKNDAQRNLIHSDDVAEIIARIVRQRVIGRFLCPSQTNVRYSEIATIAIAAFASVSAIRFDTDRPDIPDNAFAANDDLYSRIDYFPQISLAQGIALEVERRKNLS